MENVSREERFAKHWERMFGVRVKDLRTARGWTQDDLAKRMTSAGYQMHQTTVAKMESGTRPTNVGEVAALAAIFGLPISALFDSSDDVQAHLELAGLANTLATISEERIKLKERQAALDSEYESAEALYRDMERRASLRQKARE